MEKQNNNLLLTVIAIATLLVAVIGATFAYFTASLNGETETRTIVKSAHLVISFADGGSSVVTNEDIQPSLSSFITKKFTVTPATNTSEDQGVSSGVYMPYQLFLNVDTDDFAYDNAKDYSDPNGDKDTKDAIDNSGASYSQATLFCNKTGDDASKGCAVSFILSGSVNGTGSTGAKVPDIGSSTGNGRQYGIINDASVTANKKINLGVGFFGPEDDDNSISHEYILSVYYLNRNESQDTDKQGAAGTEKSFIAHLSIEALEVTELKADAETAQSTNATLYTAS